MYLSHLDFIEFNGDNIKYKSLNLIAFNQSDRK